MPRNLNCNALCLRVRAAGESNREAWFLAAGNEALEGIFKALVFGGPKSKLKSHISPFHQGKLWIYNDPVRDSKKISDFDVEVWRPGIRELYERSLAANVLAETILATHGSGGGWEGALNLAAKTLDCLETGNEKNLDFILLHFFWVWTEFLGSRPDLYQCHSCSSKIPLDKISWQDKNDGSINCDDCRGEFDTAVDNGLRRWLTATEILEPKDALKFGLEKRSLKNGKNFVLTLLAFAIGKRLPLWDYYN